MAGSRDVRAGGAFVELSLRDRLQKGLLRARARMRAFSKSVTSIGRSLSIAAGAVAAPLVLSVKTFANYGDQIGKAAQRTGVAVGALSTLRYAAERSGASFQDLEGGLRNMGRFMVDAERGMSTATDSLKDLGLTLDDFKDKTPEERFKLLAQAFSKIEDPSRKAGLAMKVFGRAGTQLIPLLNLGAAGMSALQGKAKSLGVELTDGEATAAQHLTDSLADLFDVIKIVQVKIGAALAPAVEKAIAVFTTAAKAVVDFVKENQGTIVTIAAVTAAVGAAGIALIGLGAVLSAGATVLGVLSTVVGVILSPLGLLVAGIGGLAAVFITGTDAGKEFVAILADAFRPVVQAFSRILATVKTTMGGVRDALAAGDMARAWKILMTGLELAALQALGGIRGLFGDTLANLVGQVAGGDLTGAWETAIKGITAMWDVALAGLLKGMRALADQVVGLWSSASTSIGEFLLNSGAFGFDEIKKKEQEQIAQRTQNIIRNRAKLRAQGVSEDVINRTYSLTGTETATTAQAHADVKAGVDSALEPIGTAIDTVLSGMQRDAEARAKAADESLSQENKKLKDEMAARRKALEEEIAALTGGIKTAAETIGGPGGPGAEAVAAGGALSVAALGTFNPEGARRFFGADSNAEKSLDELRAIHKSSAESARYLKKLKDSTPFPATR